MKNSPFVVLPLGCVVVSLALLVPAWGQGAEGESSRNDASESFDALLDVHFVDELNGWAVGRGTTILHTADGGRSWEVQHRSGGFADRPLYSVAFSDPVNGIAVGKDGLILTTFSGGRRWRPMARILNPARDYLSAMIPQKQVELAQAKRDHESRCEAERKAKLEALERSIKDWEAAGAEDKEALAQEQKLMILEHPCDDSELKELRDKLKQMKEYLDGAPEFVPPEEVAGHTFRRVQFADRRTAWLTTGADLLRSDDGGSVWRILQTPKGLQVRDMDFLDAQRGWIVGDGGKVYYTADGGRTWNDRSLAESWRLFSVDFVNAGDGWATGEAGVVLTTRDGGINWKLVEFPHRAAVYRLAAKTPEAAAVVTEQGAFQTRDRGVTWTRVRFEFDPPPDDEGKIAIHEVPNPLSVSFVDEQRGYIVGGYGLVAATTDGGQTWDHQRSSLKIKEQLVDEYRAITHAVFGWGVDFGYIQPVGSLMDRYSSGFLLAIGLYFGRGRVKFGPGLHVGILGSNETIYAPAGTIEDDRAVALEMNGFRFSVPLTAHIHLFNRRGWYMDAEGSVGWVYHGVEVNDEDQRDATEDDNYARDRHGFGLTQELSFGYRGADGHQENYKRLSRIGWRIRLGLSESWTWPTGGAQTDSGEEDNKNFGTELWPYVLAGVDFWL